MSNANHFALRPRRAVNLKAVSICAVVIFAVSFGMRRLHSSQVVKTTAYLKTAADTAVTRGNTQQAIRALERYLAFSHGDVDARQTLSRLLDDHATDEDTLRTVYAMNEAMLLGDTDNVELRLRQAELAVRLKLFSEAGSQLQELRSAEPQNPQVWHLSGLVAQDAVRPADAIGYFQQAIDHGSSDAATYTQLAELLTEQGASPSEVEILFDNLLEHSRSADAHGAKAHWLITQDRTDEAIVELWAGLQLAPDDIRLNGLLVSAVDSPEQQSQLTTHLKKQIRQHPSQSRLRLFCAHTEWQSGRQDDAVATLKFGIVRTPQAFELLEVLIDYLVSRGDTQQAEAAFRRLPRTAIDHARWHFLEGRVLMSSGQWRQALQSFDQASGFAGSNQPLRHRSRMCMAACRRQLGERDGALATYRSMLHDNPTSRDSRLGMAAAWLESGRTNLAIAEYRQLMDVDGVPELMTSLLIRETLKQPATRRNWRELDELLQDEEPVISDNTQRILLQADLLFAKGHPARALRSLDSAVAQHPDNVPFRSARRRVLADKQGTLNQRMEATLANSPGNPEAHVAILRMRFHQDGVEAAVSWIRAIVAGSISPQMPEQQRLLLAAQVAEAVVTYFKQSQKPTFASAMLSEATKVWDRLSLSSPRLLPRAIAFVARHQNAKAILAAIRRIPAGSGSALQAQCWLAALENTHRKQELHDSVERSLRHFVAAQPNNMQLRQAYVEYLVQFAGYDSAVTIERQILQREPHYIEALSRCAWILTMADGDQTEAMTLSESASRHAPSNASVRTTRALVLAKSNNPNQALPVFGSIPAESRTAESFAYESLALLRSGRHREALQMADRVKRQHALERWRPADRALLEDVLIQAAAAAEVVRK